MKLALAVITITLALVITNVENSHANPVAELSSRVAAPAADFSMRYTGNRGPSAARRRQVTLI